MTRTLLISLLASCAALVQAQQIDIEKFFTENFIVDGLTNYYVASHPSETSANPFPGKGQAPDFSTMKAVTGRNAAPATVSGPASLELQVKRVEQGIYKNFRVIRRFDDLRKCRADGFYGALFYKQRPWPMAGTLDILEDWKKKGLVVFQIAYGNSHPPPPGEELGFGCNEDGGLTPLGKEAIAELNRLHMLVDISHCNDQTTIETCAASSSPVVSTHANVYQLTPNRRNKSDEAFLAIAKTGGVAGITTIGWMIENPKTKTRSIQDFGDHLDYLKNLIGIDHIAVSSDTWVNGWPEKSDHFACKELSDPARWKHVAAELVRRGYTEEDLRKIFSLNWLRVFREVLEP
ncbi:MAG: membrane dipeptidase [Verrucomicrobiales bacterium]|nr:membrane dipeptidase [Verrucomicrobiales bacterium]